LTALPPFTHLPGGRLKDISARRSGKESISSPAPDIATGIAYSSDNDIFYTFIAADV
jgi:hypothetical protein